MSLLPLNPEGISPKESKILYQSKVLEDRRTLGYYSIQKETVFQLEIENSKEVAWQKEVLEWTKSYQDLDFEETLKAFQSCGVSKLTQLKLLTEADIGTFFI